MDSKLSDCPYHYCQPIHEDVVITPSKFEMWYNRDGITKSRHEIPAKYCYYVRCPKCKEDTKNRHEDTNLKYRLALGVHSFKDGKTAEKNWNKIIKRNISKVMIETLKGDVTI